MLTLDNLHYRGRWMDDSESGVCLQCKSAFNFLIRRHHCRRCGGLFCDYCSSRKLLIPSEMIVMHSSNDSEIPNRCCSACAEIVTNFVNHRQTIPPVYSTDSAKATVATAPSSEITNRSIGNGSDTQTVSPMIQESGRSQLVGDAASTVTSPSTTENALREVCCEEWKNGTVGTGKYKLYVVVVPSRITQDRRFKVSLDNREMTVVLPLHILAAETILVKAPSPPVSILRAQATLVAHTKKVCTCVVTSRRVTDRKNREILGDI
jgi:FYVE zinc finger